MRPTAAALLVLLSAAALAQTAPLAIPDGTIIEARLVRGTDSKKAKAGDLLTAETTWPVQSPSGAVLIPRGSLLSGHVAAAARQTLALVFDSVQLPNWAQAKLHATIQGVDAKIEWGVGNDVLTSCPGVSYADCYSYVPRLPIERVTIEQEANNQAVLHTNRNKVKLPKHTQLVLLVGSVDDVCRAKGIALFSEPPSLAPSSAKSDLGPALVIQDHQVLGCANSSSAWIDYPFYIGMREGTIIEGVLDKDLDSRSAKPGDEIVASVSSRVPLLSPAGGALRPGTPLLGHITQASARAKGAPDSTLAIVFDGVWHGERLPMILSLQSIKPLPGQTAPIALKPQDCGATLRTDADSVVIPKGTPVVLVVGSAK